jgi:hypothetical protein
MAAAAANSITSFMTDGSRDNPRVIVSQLGVIANIQPEKKLDVDEMRFEEPIRWLPGYIPVRRWLRGQSRARTLEHIERLLGTAFELEKIYASRDSQFDKDVTKMISTAISSVRPGLENLKTTYHGDCMFVQRIDTIVKLLDARVFNRDEQKEKPVQARAAK